MSNISEWHLGPHLMANDSKLRQDNIIWKTCCNICETQMVAFSRTLICQIVGNVNYFYNQHLSTWGREDWQQSKEDYKDTDPYFITVHPPILNSMVECHTITLSIWKVYWYVQWIQGNVKWSAIQKLPVHNLDNEYDTCHFFPDFLIPPPTRGPFCAAFALASWRAFCWSFIFCLWATSSSSISCSFFLGAFSGFFLPPSRPDMVLQHGQIAITYPKHHSLQQ